MLIELILRKTLLTEILGNPANLVHDSLLFRREIY